MLVQPVVMPVGCAVVDGAGRRRRLPVEPVDRFLGF